MNYSPLQQELIDSPFDTRIFVTGPAGCGKTAAAVAYLDHAVRSGVPAGSILILTPQRSLAKPYKDRVQQPGFPANGEVSLLTLGGLAQRMVALFWPMIARNAGFKNPSQPPQFLTLETAQYYLAQVIEPFVQKGFFDSITIEPNRIYSQLLDNMNKSAVVGFEISEISNRLKNAWSGSVKQAIVYDQSQECILAFRNYCLEHNLLDFSLQFEIFKKYLWPSTLCRSYLKGTYQHLIYDNIEEDVPTAHDVIKDWLPDFQSALLLHDTNAGFRTFLGADDLSAQSLTDFCSRTLEFSDSFVQSDATSSLENNLSSLINNHRPLIADANLLKSSFSINSFRFFPQALDWIATEIHTLISQHNVDPGDIVVLTPFLSDSLRFSLVRRLEETAIPCFTFRPSRSLRDEPAVSAMFTLAKLAHPRWGFKPSRHDLRYMLMQIIPEIDLIRADLVAQMLYSPNRFEEGLTSFAQVRAEMQQRITFVVGEKYETLRRWLERYRASKSIDLDVFFARAFGELLSQRGFSFHENFRDAALVSRLIESSRKFRNIISEDPIIGKDTVGMEYVKVVEKGLIAAQYLSNWEDQSKIHSVLIAPAFTYLMSNRPVSHQFWLDVGSSGWWSRLDQPLTQPYVLSRNWQENRQWTSADELKINQATLGTVVTGLLRRCSTHVDMVSVGMNESGSEERGALLVAIQSLLRGLIDKSGGDHV